MDNSRAYMTRWNSGKKVDRRLMMLLESFFEEIYVQRNNFLKKISPGLIYEEFMDIFNKIGAMSSWKDNDESKCDRSMQRGLSIGSPRRLERFRVKTPNVIIGSDSDRQGGGQTVQPANGSGKTRRK